MTSESKSPENIRRLTDQHLARYGGMLRRAEAGEQGFRREELRGLIAIWTEVARKGFDFAALSPREQGEVNDAICDDDDEIGDDER